MELRTVLLAGARELLAVQARELPQRDDLCGAFCGALGLNAAGLTRYGGQPLDQDAVALAAGSVVCSSRDPATLPGGEEGRRDYRLAIPEIEDPDVSGTTAAGVVAALRELSDGALAALPFSGPWTAATLDGVFDAALRCQRPVTLIANHATHHLWGSHPAPTVLLDYLCQGRLDGPGPDWEVGHFACLVARTEGPVGRLYALADTYPALGHGGLHWQPRERLAAAIDRRDKPAGGVIVLADAGEAPALRAAARELGLIEELWDNGTIEGTAPA